MKGRFLCANLICAHFWQVESVVCLHANRVFIIEITEKEKTQYDITKDGKGE